MEAEVINSFLPDLVTAVSDSVQSVSDQCLAKGLINETVYKRVLESGWTSEDKARTLILAVKKSTETDSRCLEILLNILDQELPCAIRVNLLSKIRRELTEKANTCRAVVPLSKAVQQVPLGTLSREIPLQQHSLLGRFEDSIRQHEHACAEKKLLEERLKVNLEKCERLKGELETLRGQNEKLAGNTQTRITACTKKMENLEKRIEKLQITIEEQDIQARRGRNTVITKTEKIIVQLVEQEIRRREEENQRVDGEEREQYEERMPIPLPSPRDNPDKPPDVLEEYHLGPLCNSMIPLDKAVDTYSDREASYFRWKNFALQSGLSISDFKRLEKDIAKVHISGIPIPTYIKFIMERLLRRQGSTNYLTYSRLKKALFSAELGHVAKELVLYSELPNYEI